MTARTRSGPRIPATCRRTCGYLNSPPARDPCKRAPTGIWYGGLAFCDEHMELLRRDALAYIRIRERQERHTRGQPMSDELLRDLVSIAASRKSLQSEPD